MKRREGKSKSKRREPEPRIGRQSGGKARGSPKGIRKNGGLDVKAAGRHEEVQKERARAENWTLKWWKDTRKSKKRESEPRIGR